MNNQMIKADQPNFVKIVGIGQGKEKGDWCDVQIRFNPYYVTSYHEAFVDNYKGEDMKKIVVFHVGSASYFIEMTIEEANSMMEDIDRSLSFKEKS